MDKNKKYENLADDILKNIEYSEKLRELANKGGDISILKAVDNIFTAMSSDAEDLTRVEKFNLIYETIESNIVESRKINSRNFPTKEYLKDKLFVFEHTQIINTSIDTDKKKESLIELNKIYNKHITISKLIQRK